MDTRFLSVRDVASMLGIGVSTVWAWVQKGRLPQPIRLGTRCTRWRLDEVLEAIERMAKEAGDARR